MRCCCTRPVSTSPWCGLGTRSRPPRACRQLNSLVAFHLRGAARALAELVGEIDDEDVLDALFSRFCLGK
jgi:hypothetical protein